MKFYYVYNFRCKDNSLYVGITNDLDRRMNKHNDGQFPNAYIYSKLPVAVVFYQEFNEPTQAIYFEKKMKGWSKQKKEALIKGDFDMVQTLAECRNATNSNYNQSPSTALRGTNN